MCRCYQNTFVSLDGSSAGDHRSLMFCSFNPSTSPGGGARQGSLPVTPCCPAMCYLALTTYPSSSAASRSCLSQPPQPAPMVCSCAPHISKQTSSSGTNEAPAPHFPWGILWLSSQPPWTLPSRLSTLPIFTHGQPPDPPPMGQ